MEEDIIGEEELQILINDLLVKYGYDFSNYSRTSFKRRIKRLFLLDRHFSFAAFRYRILNDKEYFNRFIEQVTVNVTEMFRDPSFYKMVRTDILPILATHPLIKIWHAGCATGEEIYSMAILLHEANLLHKSLLYATDINPSVLERAERGIFSINHMQQYTENYLKSGGVQDFSGYYTTRYGNALFNKNLSKKMVFATHNLVSDRSFNEFQFIICRNVLIYFDKELQDKVLNLFDESLEQLGYLALGAKESLRFTSISKKYKQLTKERLWRKIA